MLANNSYRRGVILTYRHEHSQHDCHVLLLLQRKKNDPVCHRSHKPKRRTFAWNENECYDALTAVHILLQSTFPDFKIGEPCLNI